jgi:replicative DNA helicase
VIRKTETTDRRQVELSVVGSMMLNVEAAEYAAGELKPQVFAFTDMRTQYQAVVDMLATGMPCDPVTVADFLARRGELVAAGGVDGIRESLNAVPHSAHVRYYVQQLSEYHRRDCLRLLSERLKRSAEDPTCEPSETIDAFLNELESIRAGNVRQSELVTASEALESLDSRNNDPAAVIPTGLSDLDRQLRGGLRAGQLIVIGGRPGLGKSALMDQIILSAAKSHRPGMIASLEMSSGEIAERALKTIGRQQFVELPVWFSEASDLAKLTGLIRLARRQHHIDVAAVDYLQLMESPREKHTLREQQVSAMSRALKRLAMELQIPILLGSQLNRESEKRVRPSLADLRESGAIEQDADIVILIAGDAESDERELIVAKHRGGPCDIVKATFDRPKFLFHTTPQSWTGHL